MRNHGGEFSGASDEGLADDFCCRQGVAAAILLQPADTLLSQGPSPFSSASEIGHSPPDQSRQRRQGRDSLTYWGTRKVSRTERTLCRTGTEDGEFPPQSLDESELMDRFDAGHDGWVGFSSSDLDGDDFAESLRRLVWSGQFLLYGAIKRSLGAEAGVEIHKD